MLTLLRHMDLQHYMPRSYVIAATDKMGAAKANTFEAAAAQTASSQKEVGFHRLSPAPQAAATLLCLNPTALARDLCQRLTLPEPQKSA